MPLSLQSATPDHIDTLLALMHQMQSDDPWDEPFHDLTVKSNLSTLLNNPIYGLVFLALDGSTPIAYLILCFDFSLEYRGKGAWIDELFVTSSYRRKGIASQLLHLAESASLQHQAQFLHLEVTHSNPAIELYRRRGFLDHHRFLMSKPLTN